MQAFIRPAEGDGLHADELTEVRVTLGGGSVVVTALPGRITIERIASDGSRDTLFAHQIAASPPGDDAG